MTRRSPSLRFRPPRAAPEVRASVQRSLGDHLPIQAAVDIVSLDVAVELFDNLASTIIIALAGAPVRGLRNEQVNNALMPSMAHSV
jgi:hypothetical protein